MSVDNVKLFLSKLVQDEGKMEQIKREAEAIKNEMKAKENGIDEYTQEELLVKAYSVLNPIAEAEGYSFTLEDFKSYQENSQIGNDDGQVSEDELDLVAGGYMEGACLIGGGCFKNGIGFCAIVGLITEFRKARNAYICFVLGAGSSI